ncbi:MAG: broad specificity phosphatase PhoE, partial [Myxococcota bacterium]
MNEIILVRHGETDGQSSIRLNGITDVNLSDLGREQMRRAAATLTDVRFDRSYVSTLRRSRQSYEIVAEAATCTAPIEEAAFREVNFGDWEAMTWAEVEALDP